MRGHKFTSRVLLLLVLFLVSACTRVSQTLMLNEDILLRTEPRQEVVPETRFFVEPRIEGQELLVDVETEDTCAQWNVQVVDRTVVDERHMERAMGDLLAGGVFTLGGAIALGLAPTVSDEVPLQDEGTTSDQSKVLYAGGASLAVGAVLLTWLAIKAGQSIDDAKHVGEIELPQERVEEQCNRRSAAAGVTVSIIFGNEPLASAITDTRGTASTSAAKLKDTYIWSAAPGEATWAFSIGGDVLLDQKNPPALVSAFSTPRQEARVAALETFRAEAEEYTGRGDLQGVRERVAACQQKLADECQGLAMALDCEEGQALADEDIVSGFETLTYLETKWLGAQEGTASQEEFEEHLTCVQSAIKKHREAYDKEIARLEEEQRKEEEAADKDEKEHEAREGWNDTIVNNMNDTNLLLAYLFYSKKYNDPDLEEWEKAEIKRYYRAAHEAFIVWNAGKVGNYGSEGFEKAMEHVCGVEEGAMYVELNYEGYEIPSADCLDWLLSP